MYFQYYANKHDWLCFQSELKEGTIEFSLYFLLFSGVLTTFLQDDKQSMIKITISYQYNYPRCENIRHFKRCSVYC